jgi:MscS family membrane protein
MKYFSTMKVKFDGLFRCGLVLLLLVWGFGLWALGQATNAEFGAVSATNRLPVISGQNLSFGLDRLPFFDERTFLGQPLWKYLSLLVYIFLAFVVAKLIDYLTCAWLTKLTAKTQTTIDDVLLRLLRGPLKVVCFVVLLHIGLNFFEWPGRITLYLSKALILVVGASLIYLAVKLVNVFLDLWRRRHGVESDRKFNDQLFSIIRKSLNLFITIVGILIVAQNLGINITAAITSLSIGGLAVGLAAQDTLANLFGAIAVFADKPFRVGDHIKIVDIEGVVESVGMRSTRVRNPEGYLVSIPNKTVGNANISNITQRASIKTVMNLTLAPDLPSAKVRRALELLDEIYRSQPQTEDVWVSFNQFAGRVINIMVVHWWKGTDQKTYLAGIQEMNLVVKDRFDAESIKLA